MLLLLLLLHGVGSTVVWTHLPLVLLHTLHLLLLHLLLLLLIIDCHIVIVGIVTFTSTAVRSHRRPWHAHRWPWHPIRNTWHSIRNNSILGLVILNETLLLLLLHEGILFGSPWIRIFAHVALVRSILLLLLLQLLLLRLLLNILKHGIVSTVQLTQVERALIVRPTRPPIMRLLLLNGLLEVLELLRHMLTALVHRCQFNVGRLVASLIVIVLWLLCELLLLLHGEHIVVVRLGAGTDASWMPTYVRHVADMAVVRQLVISDGHLLLMLLLSVVVHHCSLHAIRCATHRQLLLCKIVHTVSRTRTLIELLLLWSCWRLLERLTILWWVLLGGGATRGLYLYPEKGAVGDVVAEDNSTVFIVVNSKLYARIDSKIL